MTALGDLVEKPFKSYYDIKGDGLEYISDEKNLNKIRNKSLRQFLVFYKQVELSLENQLGRRNLNDAQRIDVVDRLFGLKEKQEAEKRMKSGNPVPNLDKGRVSEKLGKKAKVSHRTR